MTALCDSHITHNCHLKVDRGCVGRACPRVTASATTNSSWVRQVWLALTALLVITAANEYFVDDDGDALGSDYSDAASDPGPPPSNASYVQPPLSRHLAAVVVGVSDPNLQYVGRWMAGSIAGTKRFDWGGTTIRMTITGTTSLGVAITVRMAGCACLAGLSLLLP